LGHRFARPTRRRQRGRLRSTASAPVRARRAPGRQNAKGDDRLAVPFRLPHCRRTATLYTEPDFRMTEEPMRAISVLIFTIGSVFALVEPAAAQHSCSAGSCGVTSSPKIQSDNEATKMWTKKLSTSNKLAKGVADHTKSMTDASRKLGTREKPKSPHPSPRRSTTTGTLTPIR
jgi:hypothetical protein